MRLFVAVNFDDKLKMKLARLIGELQKNAERGNFSRIQNLHMTLQFIGETDRLKKAAEAVEKVDFSSFPISFEKLSGFKRQGTEICWLGVSDDKELKGLAASVGRELKSRGFALEDRPFVAHLTLGREVVFKKSYEPEKIELPPELSATVGKICLMKSERVNGVLTYSEIMSRKAADI